MTSGFGLGTDSVFLYGQPSSQPQLDKDGQPIKTLHLAKAKGGGPALDKTYLRSNEMGILRTKTKTAEEVCRALQST